MSYLLIEIEAKKNFAGLLKLYGEINRQLPHVSVKFEVAFHDLPRHADDIFSNSLKGLKDSDRVRAASKYQKVSAKEIREKFDLLANLKIII